ncbi:hypothetical protein HPB48_008146 [Haemaphysalis longicornis]|uniref:Oxidoreductase n=1 Tax=Haemaphysalis longicornis TaxID=44386 RepID=A0A9J6GJ21_HAELO|nr:hypothetical protein HPB48_008146 [Haemaphysalis longicornis]
MLPGVGVLGTGKSAQALVPCLRDCGFKVEAIWGRSTDTAKEAASELGIPFYTSKEDEVLLRKSVDFLCIMCPPHQHAKIAVKALGIGKHVLCDCPASVSQSEVLKMVGAAEYYPTLISVLCHSLRFSPPYVHMKRHIQEGYVGKVQVIEARVHCGSLVHDRYDWTWEDTMGGVLSTFGSHVIDIVSFVTGVRAVRAHGVTRTLTKATDPVSSLRRVSSDDFCTFQMEMSNGACATVTLNSNCDGRFIQELQLWGESGNLMVRCGDLYGQRKGATEELLYEDKDSNEEPDLLPKPHATGLANMVMALRDAFASQPHDQVWAQQPVDSAASFDDGLYVQAVIEAVRRSSETHQWAQVKLLQEEIRYPGALSSLYRMGSTSF